MSLEINSSTPLNIPPPPADLQQTSATQQKHVHEHDEKHVHGHKEKHHDNEMRESRPPDLFRALDKMFAERSHKGKHFEKSFEHLAHSLEKAFGESPKVDRQTGEEEMRHSGLKRVGKDLTRLFKGLGIPKELARQFSDGMTDAMKSGDVEQVDFSLSVTRAFNLEVQQLQQGYLANGDGSMVAASISNSFQLSAVRVRSLDISINMRTGEFSMTRSRMDAVTMSSTSSAGILSSEAEPAVDDRPVDVETTAATEAQSTDPGAATAPSVEPEVSPADSAPTTEIPAEPTNDFAALVQTNSQLLQISRMVQQSAVMHLQPAGGVENVESENADQAQPGLNAIADMFSRFEEMTRTVNSLFESLVQVNNLRLEKEDDDDHLRFSVEALAPIGLGVTNEDGRASTLYSRPDGSLAKVVEDPLQVSA